MLQTLIQIGKQVSKGRGEWDDIIDVPNVAKEQEKKLRLLTATILFDLDKNEIILNTDSVKEYEEDDAFTYKNIKVQGGNNKAIYTCVFAPKSLEQFRKTFFGVLDKEGKAPEKGQFNEAIEKDFAYLSDSLLYRSLKNIFLLRDIFEQQFIDSETKSLLYKPPQKSPESHTSIYQILTLSKQDVLVLLASSVKSTELGISEPTLISNLEGYEDFMRDKFLNRGGNSSTQKKRQVCYASGKVYEDVAEIAFSNRYSLNKMFVTTTRNFASSFSADSFNLNYQASGEIQKYLERGSDYVLKNHTVLIAEVNHCILPQVFSQSKIDETALLTKLSKRSELLFRPQEYKDLSTQIEDAEPDVYWIDFLGFESDGNYFKTINYIKDVSKTHFNRLLKTFQQVHREFKNVAGIEWDKVMSRGKDSSPMSLNFQIIYSLIPLRKDKEKKNEALVHFKAILEQRKLDPNKLFGHYRELVLCHRFHRYKSYTNIYAPETIKDKTSHFDFAVRNATYQYHAIFQVLNRLNLLKDMEETINTDTSAPEGNESYQEKLEAFFTKMRYKEPHKAMFYLGRSLSGIASAQVQAKHANKPILEKVNYNGMDVRSILKLYKELREKVKQYAKFNTFNYVEPSLRRFDERFQPENWELGPEEALFYLFAGYSFWISNDKKENK